MSLSISPKSATATKSDQELSFVLSGSNSKGYTAVNLKLYYGASTDPSGDLDAAMAVWSVGGGLENVPGLIIESNTFSNSSSSGSLSFRITPEIAELYSEGSKILTFLLLWQRTDEDYAQFTINYNPTGRVSEPTSPKLSATLSRDAVELSWGAGSAGTNNSVTGYDVQRRESSDGNSWGSWEKVPNSPVTTTKISVSPPNTAGSYYQFRVRTRGSAGSNYYSKWVTRDNGEATLRRDHDTLAGFTDDPLTAGTSLVKALHMQELQSRVSTLRTFYGLGTYNFATITAGTTSLAGWTTHVNQIRAAIEDVCNASGKTHESWISFSVNCPRADVIQQLRSVILAL